MTTEMTDLVFKVAGFGYSISERMGAHNVPTPGSPIPGGPNNSPNEERIRDVDADLQGELRIHLKNCPTPKSYFILDKHHQRKLPRRTELP